MYTLQLKNNASGEMALIGLPDAVCHKPPICKNSDYLGSTVNSCDCICNVQELNCAWWGVKETNLCFLLVQNWKYEMQLIFIYWVYPMIIDRSFSNQKNRFLYYLDFPCIQFCNLWAIQVFVLCFFLAIQFYSIPLCLFFLDFII